MENEIPSYIWWSLGIDPNDPSEWSLMSAIAEQVYLEWVFYVRKMKCSVAEGFQNQTEACKMRLLESYVNKD